MERAINPQAANEITLPVSRNIFMVWVMIVALAGVAFGMPLGIYAYRLGEQRSDAKYEALPRSAMSCWPAPPAPAAAAH